ncbi:hypothetical protein DVA67_013070 [Solirubrobacter sp. CPCC 204708]|uniref:Uncharacterized protein n=1 Tax=Solirubrobacter deserti TaxID=2282478 RepID=A0ABT4RMT5_9ACTN|nr:hypothetical protein [Solirubrobacter deserti]MBE2316907.1 hypothetical protein [Solirubrobacter deserti]MDA0139738.1 hypothetical protein [Solirubrobacter deserti]
MDPIYRVIRRDPSTGAIERVDKPRLLSPAEREEARRQREEKRREVDERSARRPPKKSPQEPRRGTDYYG